VVYCDQGNSRYYHTGFWGSCVSSVYLIPNHLGDLSSINTRDTYSETRIKAGPASLRIVI
jgi:hypothetical protein